AVGVISDAIDTIRELWAGRRVPPGTPNVPPVEPMFPPVHHVPIYVAGYRTPMLELAGRKGDGYLSRPLESLASFRGMVPKIRKASAAAGRPEGAVSIAGYLFSLVDETRRAALNRAKREPFVIYMMAIHTDGALCGRCALRARVSGARAGPGGVLAQAADLEGLRAGAGPGRCGRRPGGVRLAVPLGAVPRGPVRDGPAAHRDERPERDRRRPQ